MALKSAWAATMTATLTPPFPSNVSVTFLAFPLRAFCNLLVISSRLRSLGMPNGAVARLDRVADGCAEVGRAGGRLTDFVTVALAFTGSAEPVPGDERIALAAVGMTASSTFFDVTTSSTAGFGLVCTFGV